MSIVAFGELLLRLKSPGAERLLQGALLESSFGGTEFNVAALLSRLGIASEYVTVLPPNPLGEAARAEIRRHGVGDNHVRTAEGRLGLYFLEGGAGLRPSRVVYDRAESAFARLDERTLDWAGILAGARLLHLSGISAAVGPGPLAAMSAAARHANDRSIEVSFDVNWRQQLWHRAASAPVDALAPILEHCSVVFAGVTDARVCLGDQASIDGDPTSDAAFAAFAGAMFARYPRLQILVAPLRQSRSAEDQEIAALCRSRGGADHRSTAIRIPHTIDRIGTGDAFVAGCLFGHLSGWEWSRSCAFGLAASALKHGIPGDIARIDRAEIDAAITGDGVGRVLR